ncbi:hypothetical protein [Rhizobium leguminosarum]|uniref:hypothetical protein n=1 Tax=Rhizobium leguminosarum TaxID=384 RepID=UPI0010316732|nr:hypothetical protein [Rhizobium leguminosarum]TAX26845.1 hypothetical protein ELI06_27570 [Rhizobium leguminosarum]
MNGRALFPRFLVLHFVMTAFVTLTSPAAVSAQTSQDTEFSVPVRIVPDNLSVQEALRQRSAAERHDALDLEAQERSAIAAETAATASETQVWIGWLQLTVSAIGALGLIFTLLLTWASTKAATAAAKAALNANQLAQENFFLDQRPWIKLERPVIQLAEHQGTFAIQFSVEAINVGKTPAKETELHLQISFGKIMTPGVEGVEAYAQSVANPGTWRNSHKIVFPNAGRPMDDAVILDEPPPEGESCRIRYCVNYRGASTSAIYHTAGEVTFPVSRLISSPKAQKNSWKYNFHGTGSVA